MTTNRPSRRILIVDDEPSVSELIRAILQDQGYEIVVAENGRIALSLFDDFKPDLIVTDISMPEMEGIEFIKRVREKKKHVPIVAMSGNAVGVNFLEATKILGAAATLRKPFSTQDLLASVRSSLLD